MQRNEEREFQQRDGFGTGKCQLIERRIVQAQKATLMSLDVPWRTAAPWWMEERREGLRQLKIQKRVAAAILEIRGGDA